MLAACGRAIPTARCELRGTSQQREVSASARVRWTHGTEVTIEVSVSLSPGGTVRRLTFLELDTPAERWRSVGLVIGTIAGVVIEEGARAVERDAMAVAAVSGTRASAAVPTEEAGYSVAPALQAAPSASAEPPGTAAATPAVTSGPGTAAQAPPAPEPRPPPPAIAHGPSVDPPSTPGRPATPEDAGNTGYLASDMSVQWAALMGSAFEGDAIRYGGQVSGRLAVASVFLRGGVSYAVTSELPSGLRSQWATGFAGIAERFSLGGDWSLGLHVSGAVQRFGSQLDSSGGASDNISRWRVGAQSSVDVCWNWGPRGAIFLAPQVNWFPATTAVSVAAGGRGLYDPPLQLSALLGLRLGVL